MLTVNDVVSVLEAKAPPALQESYDNSGLITGNPADEVKGILICLDVTPEVVDEALINDCNLIVSHHPPVFSGIKRFTGPGMTEKVLIKAIKNDLVLYSAHTNLDSVPDGVSGIMAEKLGLSKTRILVPRRDDLLKLVCFIPVAFVEKVSRAIFDAGAGHIGNYDSCSYQTDGNGTYRAGADANPFIGTIGEYHREPEVRFETILPRHLQRKVTEAMLRAHPYEEVAYDLYPIANLNLSAGMGIIGEFPEEMPGDLFLDLVKKTFQSGMIRHSAVKGKKIRTVAVCGGSGGQFIPDAAGSGADAYVTAEIRYHNWFDIPEDLLVVDIGHYESEQFAMQVLYESLIEKFPTFAVRLTEVNTNPLNYL